MTWLHLNESIKTSSTYNVPDCLMTAGIEVSQGKHKCRDSAGSSCGWRGNTDMLLVSSLRIHERLLISRAFTYVFS